MSTATMSALKPLATFGAPRFHADGDLLALAFGNGGNLFSVEEPGVLRRWDFPSGRQLDWQALSDLETIWAFSRDARLLASGSDDLTLWETGGGRVLHSLPQSSWITALAFGADGNTVATGHDDGVVRVWNLAGETLLQEWKLHRNSISALTFSPHGGVLAAAGEDRVINIFEVSTGLHLGRCVGHTDRIPALTWHPGGEYLVSAGWDGTARVWRIRDQEPVFLFNNHVAQVSAVAFSADGTRFASADWSHQIHLWDFPARRPLHVLLGPQGEIGCLAFSPDGRQLAAGGDVRLHLWDTQSGGIRAGGPPLAARTSLAVLPDGSGLVASAGGAAPRIWNLANPRPLTLPAEGPIHGLAVGGNGHRIAGAAEKSLRLWDQATGKVVLDAEGPEDNLNVVAGSPDGQWFATASNAGADVWVWQAQGGAPALIIPDPLFNCTVEALAFHPDNRRLAIGGIDWMATGGSSGGISIWDLRERCEVAVFPGGATGIAFHPDGRRLAAATTDQSICLWEVASQQFLVELTGHEGVISGLAFSPDGQWLASAGEDRTLRLWTLEGEEHALHELDSQITALAFSPDGRYLFVAQANTTCAQYALADLLG